MFLASRKYYLINVETTYIMGLLFVKYVLLLLD